MRCRSTLSDIRSGSGSLRPDHECQRTCGCPSSQDPPRAGLMAVARAFCVRTRHARRVETLNAPPSQHAQMHILTSAHYSLQCAHVPRLASVQDSLLCCSFTGTPAGAAHRRWCSSPPQLTAAGFCVIQGRAGGPFSSCRPNARKVTQLLRFRLGCHRLPSDVGRHRADPLPRHA